MSTLSDDSSDYKEPPAPTKQVPLRFAAHNFGAYCYNTLHCSVVYNDHDFTILDNNEPSRSPRPDESKNWSADHLDIRNFPLPAEVKWTAKDGSAHEAKVDIGAIFKDGLIWHNVARADLKDFYSGPYADNPDIMLVVDDHTVSVYTKTFIPTKTLQRPGHPDSDYRADVLLAWSHTY